MIRMAFFSFIIAAMVITYGCGNQNNQHQNHDHAGHADHGTEFHDSHNHAEHQSEHADHEHDESTHEQSLEHDGHDHSEDEGVVLSPQSQKIAGIMVQAAQRRFLKRTIELPGRVGYNEDRLMHITPRYAGVARNVGVQLGRYVRKGDVLVEIESNQSMSTYAVKAPFSGYIIEKHIVPGEHVIEGQKMFVLADLSSVWINCDVFAANMDYINTGATAVVPSVGAQRSDTGTVSYVAPHFNSATNSGLVRIPLPNTAKQWRPGMFIRAQFKVALQDSVIAVEQDAVQVLGGESVVFQPGPNNTFKNLPVTLGRRAGRYVEVLSGLHEGEQYVAGGAFEIKATIVTSGMDPHAGHGH